MLTAYFHFSDLVNESATVYLLSSPIIRRLLGIKFQSPTVTLEWKNTWRQNISDGLIMAALRSRCGHYIFAVSSFSPRLISSVADWMSTILLQYTWCGSSANLECRSEMCHMQLGGNAGCKKSPKICYLRTIAQLCGAIPSQLRHVSIIGKKLV